MTLNESERALTSGELRAQLARTGLSAEAVAEVLEFEPERFEAAVAVSPSCDPADVWLLRDFLDGTLRAKGVDAGTWTVLTDSARRAASLWFYLREPPEPPA